MIDWVIHVLAFFGASYILGHSKISLPFREMLVRSKVGAFVVELLECPACSAVHFSWILTAFGPSLFPRTFWGFLGGACFFAATSFILGRVTGIIPSAQRDFFEERHITEFNDKTQV